MRFVSFVRAGQPGFGLLRPDGIFDLSRRFGPSFRTLKQTVAAELLYETERWAHHPTTHALSDVALLPVIPNPDKIFCVGVNYEAHRAETKREVVGHPTIFTRFADTLVAHGAPLVKPRLSDRLDFEGELAVVIGRGGRNIPEARAMDHVAGYAPFNDGSVRDFQRHTSQFTPGKNFSGTGGFGPALVTPEEVGPLEAVPIATRVNGEVVQQATLADLIFSIPRVIAYLSSFTPLSPGDVIATGTPGGVGERREPPLWLKAGDVVEVDLGPVGTLRNGVVAE